MARVIKYILNIVGLIWMGTVALLSYGLIVKFPPCDRVMSTVWSNVKDLALIYALFLTVITLVNWLIQRRFERRREAKEYIVLGLIDLALLTLITYYFSYDFYSHCGLSV